MKYIAYGSNLNLTQMAYRCPGAYIITKGYLKDHTLAFCGSKTGSYATVLPKKGDKVPVTVWEIDNQNEEALDLYEGYPTFYYKRIMDVETGDGIIKAMIYIMRDDAKRGEPSEQYIMTCLQGYADNQFDSTIFIKFITDNNALI